MSPSICPVCQEAELQREASGALVCEYCHANLVGGQLRCPNCHTLSPIGAETCPACDEPLTLFGRIMIRQGIQTKSHRLEQMRTRAGTIKEQARLSSDARMAEFIQIDQRRIEHERADLYAQQQRDRRLYRNVALGFGIFLFLVAAISLVILL